MSTTTSLYPPYRAHEMMKSKAHLGKRRTRESACGTWPRSIFFV